MTVRLHCPVDGGPLAPDAERSGWSCPRCTRVFPVEDGVIRFLEKDDDFYEDHYADWTPVRFVPRSERLSHSWPLWLIKSGYPWEVRRQLPAGSVVMEVGCSSGVAYFGQRYRMIGVDVAQSGLVKAARLYEVSLKADITARLPLADDSVDGVISSFVWEHLPPETKPRVLQEWRRVLRPGGKVVQLYDVETDNPLLRRLKRRDPGRYHELYIEREHHHGYQTPDENRRLFEEAGFRVIRRLGNEKSWIQSPSEYVRIGQWPGWPRVVGRLGGPLSRKPLLFPYTAVVRTVDATVGRLLPLRWARTVLDVCQLPGAHSGS